MPGSFMVFDSAVERLRDWLPTDSVLDARQSPAGLAALADTAHRFDLVILGDSLSRMPKSAGLDLLNALVYRSAYLVITAPEFELHDPTRVSVWSERDLGWHDLWAWDNCRAVSLLILRGYQQAAVSLTELVERFNSGTVPIHEFYERESQVRPVRLRLVNLARETSYRAA